MKKSVMNGVENTIENNFHDIEVMLEKSHGALKFDFRQAYDYDTGHAIKIIYGLDGINVHNVGDGYLSNKSNTKETNQSVSSDIQKNIKKKGNADHRSSNQIVKAIVDRVTGSKLSKVRMIGPHSPAVNNSFLSLNTKALHDYYNGKGQDFINSHVSTIEVGKIDSTPSFKSTHWFNNDTSEMKLRGGISIKSDNTIGRRTAAEGMKYARGSKLNNLKDTVIPGKIEYNTESVNEHIKLVAKKDIESDYFIDWFFKMDEWRSISPTDFDFAILENTSHNIVFGYFTDNKVDAIIRIKTNKEPYMISMLFVNPAIQGQGVGDSLMSHAIDLYGDHPMTLNVFGDNTTALHLYKKYGFNVVSKHFNSDEGDEDERNRWVFNMERKIKDINMIEENVNDIMLEPIHDTFNEDVTSEVLKRISPEKRSKIISSNPTPDDAPVDTDEDIDDTTDVLDKPLEDDEDKEPPEVNESFPKKTDAEEAPKNGVVRKQLYIEFIEYAKKINNKNTFGSLFDKDAFTLYSFVPHELRYFYRLANPLLCVLNDELVFFSVSELRKINKGNKKLHEYIIFASNNNNLLKVFNKKDLQVYDAHFDKEIILDTVIAKTFDLYIQGLVGASLISESTEETNESED